MFYFLILSFIFYLNLQYFTCTLAGFPNGLSIDYVAERLYWVDAKLDKIETSTLEGNNRVTLIQNVPHPFGLTVVSRNLLYSHVKFDLDP